jgi:hypothetical protein
VCLCWAPDPNSLWLGAWGHKGVKAQIFFPTKKWLTKMSTILQFWLVILDQNILAI